MIFVMSNPKCTFAIKQGDFVFHRSCLQHYKTNPYNEEHEFKLQIKPALISDFCQKYEEILWSMILFHWNKFNYEIVLNCRLIHVFHREQPMMWGVEVSSGQDPHEVRTCLQLSDRPLVDHIIFKTGVLFSMLIPNIIHVTLLLETQKISLIFFRSA